jgi:transcriptional regulator with XRE-family HTH domain
MSQEEFARRFCINIGTLRNWEQGVRSPEGPARILLMVIDTEPEAVERAIKSFKPRQVGTSGPKKSAARARAEAVRTPRRRKHR